MNMHFSLPNLCVKDHERRSRRMASLMQKELGDILRRMLSLQVGISRIVISKDIGHASVYLHFFEKSDKKTIQFLQKNTYLLKKKLAQKGSYGKRIPSLRFVEEKTTEYYHNAAVAQG